MAEFTSSPGTGDYAEPAPQEFVSTPVGNRLAALTNTAGAVVSLALIVGVGIWGYKLLVRDVSGIPVVRAAEGEMRVRPEDPGGQLAQHQGLSVNVVAAEGEAAAPADELRLAPKPVDITEEDQVVPAVMVAAEPQPEPATPAPIPDVAAALQAGNVDELVSQLTEGLPPLTGEVVEPAASEQTVAAIVESAVAEALSEPVAEAVVEPEPVPEAKPAVIDAPGVRQSLRPQKRPTRRVEPVGATLTSATAAPAAADVDPDSLPIGTRLAQLGAFDSEEVAREQWDQLSQRFSPYMSDKKRVVQKASSGGRVFYRLRAMGFEDIADARRFCSALVAQNADCIPVVTR